MSPVLTDEQVRPWLPLARAIAGRYRRGGVDDHALESDALLGLLAALASHAPRRGRSLRGHLAVVVRCRVIDGLRADGPFQRSGRDRHPNRRLPADERPDRRADRRDRDRETVDDLLGLLTDADEALMRRYWLDGLTMAEVGRELGVSESRISQQLSAAMDELRQAMARGGRHLR